MGPKRSQMNASDQEDTNNLGNTARHVDPVLKVLSTVMIPSVLRCLDDVVTNVVVIARVIRWKSDSFVLTHSPDLIKDVRTCVNELLPRSERGREKRRLVRG